MHRFGKVRGILTCLLCMLAAASAMASPAGAQEAPDHAVTGAELRDAVSMEARADAAERARLKRLLSSEEVRVVAEGAGLSMDRARSAVEMLEGRALQRASSLAGDVEEQLAGGQSTVTISTTTIIIVLLVLILVAVA